MKLPKLDPNPPEAWRWWVYIILFFLFPIVFHPWWLAIVLLAIYYFEKSQIQSSLGKWELGADAAPVRLDRYVQFRRDVARSVGVGFELPKALTAKRPKDEKISQSGVTELTGRQVETEAIPC